MKRITLVLKTSEVMSVRKAACIAGADRVVALPVSNRESVCFPSSKASFDDAPVRLYVTVTDSLSNGVVSAILASARFGKIEKINSINAKQALSHLCLLAA